MTRLSSSLLSVLICGVLALFAPSSRAAELDWNSVNWTAGGLTQSFDVDASNPGDDITITVTGDTGSFEAGYPDDSTTANGSTANTGGTGQEALQLNINSFSTTAQTVTVTITFNYDGGVLPSFTLYDIDFGSGSYQDLISNITGLTVSGSTIGATTVTGSTANVVAGSGTGATITGTASVSDSPTSNGSISFSSTRVTQISFTYGNGAGAPANPGQQWVGLSDIFWAPVPEVGSSFAALLACGGVIGLRRMRVRRA